MKMLVAIVAVVVGLSGFAHADAPGETPPSRVAREKKVSTAFLATLAATSAPLMVSAIGAESCEHDACGASFGVIGMAGMVLGPSAGHWYAGKGVTTGLVLRGSAVTGMVFLALRDPYLDDPVLTIGGLIAAVGVWETGVIWDLVTLPRAVRRHNRKTELLLAPVVGEHASGLAVSGRW
jgi:hypothetical protein